MILKNYIKHLTFHKKTYFVTDALEIALIK